jgi:GCN5-like protein 1 (GCN5L1)
MSSHRPSATTNRQNLESSLNRVGSSLDADMRDRMTTIHSNNTQLAAQQVLVAKETAKLAKQNAQWQKMADKSAGQLKEIGDIQNWAEMIENDFLIVEETLRLAEGGHGADAGEGGWAGEADYNNGNGSASGRSGTSSNSH